MVEVLEAQLEPQQELFCRCYVKHFNGMKAAVEAGYAKSGSHTQSNRLLKNVNVQKRIRQLLSARLKRHDLSGDQILAEIKRVAYFDPRLLYDENNVMLPVNKWPTEVAMCIQAIETSEIRNPDGFIVGYTQKVKFWDKLKALEMLGKNKHLFSETVEHKHEHKVVVVSMEQMRELDKKLDSEY